MVSTVNAGSNRLAIEEKVIPLFFIKGSGLSPDIDEADKPVVSRKIKQQIKIINNMNVNFDP